MFTFNATGNLTKDAEVRQFEDRFAISMSIAINKRIKDKDDIVTYLNLVYWTKSDKIVQYLTKGKKIGVTGSWYENKKSKDGDKYFQTFYVSELEFLSQSQEAKPQSQNTTTNNENPFGNDDDDDLPF
ncbi:hypothetical protein CMU19_04305 [Elizabethkingia anophelis]|nr:hypothetical protein [Elizabethkingia anophelis]